MKILLVYYSRTGNTKKMGDLIAQRLNADVDEIIDHTNRSGIKGWIMGGHDAVKKLLTKVSYSKDPSRYDLVIVGTPVWAWNATPAVRTYLTENKNNIKKIAFFVTSGGDSPDKTVAYLEELLNKKSVTFTGWTNAELNQHQEEPKLKNFVTDIKK